MPVLTNGDSWRQPWRRLSCSDEDADIKSWGKKLDFMDPIYVGKFSHDTLQDLQALQCKLLKILPRIRGGGTSTKTHGKGVSLGRTVTRGGTNSIQMSAKMRSFKTLQEEAIRIITRCVEEAFGSSTWYRQVKDVFRDVPETRRLPNSSLPSSHIWWSWDFRPYNAHIDRNIIPPCFIISPESHNGAELLVDLLTGRKKIPLKAGSVVGGAWARYAHCNNILRSGKEKERFSFVVYFSADMLKSTYIDK